jgi:uncharacterized RDD family membrane protein YckC
MQDFDLIETPENVELERPLAGIGSRLTAGLLDHLVTGLVLVLLPLGMAGLSVVFVGPDSEPGRAVFHWWRALQILAFFAVYAVVAP